MPNIPFTARVRDGRWKVRLRVPRLYDLDEAATALAVVSPDPPSRFGVATAQRLLHIAADQGVTGSASGKVDQAVVATYRQFLVDLAVFPDPGNPPADAAAWAARTMPITSKLRQGRWVVRLDGERLYDLDEAATALAVVLPVMPDRFGMNTAHGSLGDAAQRGVSGREKRADPDVAAAYRHALVDLGIFPGEAAG